MVAYVINLQAKTKGGNCSDIIFTIMGTNMFLLLFEYFCLIQSMNPTSKKSKML